MSDDSEDDLPGPTSDPFTIVGSSSILHPITPDNLATATSSFLVPCHSPDLLVDRYDVRLLLDATRLPAPSPDHADAGDEEAQQAAEQRSRQREALLHDEYASSDWSWADLETERYRDLLLQSSTGDSDGSSFDDSGDEGDEHQQRKRRRTTEGNRWHFVYSTQESEPTEEPMADVAPSSPPMAPSPPFLPPYDVPPSIELPCSVPLHRLMRATAVFFRDAGGQAEVFLKAKVAQQPAFAFLHPAHPLQPYFDWIRRTKPSSPLHPSSPPPSSPPKSAPPPPPPAPPGMRRRTPPESAQMQAEPVKAEKAEAVVNAALPFTAEEAAPAPALDAVAEQIRAAKARLLLMAEALGSG